LPDNTLETLLATAAFIGIAHTATGPDHFLPFIALSRAGNWSLRKTMIITAACGVGHVASSVVLGLTGLAIGAAVAGLVNIESFRGGVAGWLLFGFGLAYMVWGLRRAWRNRPHAHVHAHADGTVHYHKHVHDVEHAHVHAPEGGSKNTAAAVAPWIVFLIFVFGPCEPLIPLLMYPAAEASLTGSMLVAVVFGLATLSTMMAMVAIGYLGLLSFASGSLERYGHAACGAAIAMCGAAVVYGL
jgi:nickel/cobalt transporter (NicO) family protein